MKKKEKEKRRSKKEKKKKKEKVGARYRRMSEWNHVKLMFSFQFFFFHVSFTVK